MSRHDPDGATAPLPGQIAAFDVLPVAQDLAQRVACSWCRRVMPAGLRRDARYCRKACRQAAHRAKIGRAELEATDRALRLAYADPPYPGKAELYRDHPDYGGEVDHAALVSLLATFDGWALSTSAAALPSILELASQLEPRRVRVAAWIRGARPHATARLLNGWEPVLFVPARLAGDRPRATDALIGPTPRRRATLPSWVIGAKPPAFARWVFELLGALPGDELADLFPGSGLVARSWAHYTGADPSREDPEDASRGSAWDASRGDRADASRLAGAVAVLA